MNILEQLLKDYMKQMQKIKVKATSVLIVNKQKRTVITIQNKGQVAIQTAQTSTRQASHHLELAVQGQFGQKVTQVLEQQQETLNRLI